MSSVWRAIFLVLAFSCLLGCSKSEKQPSGTVLVAMADNSFSPSIVHVPVGGSVLFHNAGRSAHNAVSIEKAWSTEHTFGNISMPPESMTEIVFPKEGVYHFYCTFHGTPDGKAGMVGVIVVGDVQYTPATGNRGVLATVERSTGVTRHVPKDYPDVQSAVDAATPGDLVLVDPGTYVESIFVTTPSITIRGVNRNSVILDGKFTLGTGIMVGANAVAIENMTARNYTLNGFYWTGIKGFRGSYLTAYNNGDYGIYAFGASDGVFEHSYASGSPDSAFYIGQCYPCRAILDDVTGEYSGLGYSGTNSGGEMYIVRSRFLHNRTGVSTTTFDIELYPPGRDSTLIGNYIADSGLANEAAGFYATETLAGNGIALAGTQRNLVERNTILRSRNHGILILPLLDRHYWTSGHHVVRNNIVLNSGRADLAAGGFGTVGNCFAGNRYRTSIPWGLEVLNGCGRARLPIASDLSTDMTFFGSIAQVFSGAFSVTDYRNRPAPPPQPNMPGGVDAPVVPAAHPFQDHKLDLPSITAPGAAT